MMIAKYLSEMWTAVAPSMGNHLWQSTLLAIVAGLLTLMLRKNQARARYWLWLAASLKFLVPFSLVVGIGGHIVWARTSDGIETGFTFAMDELSQPFTQPVTEASSHATASIAPTVFASIAHLLPIIIPAVWLCGFLAVIFVWCARWRRMCLVMRDAEPLHAGREMETLRRLERTGGLRKSIEILLSRASLEPGVFGIARPVLVWPQGISERLDDAHVEAILAHEVGHVRRRDNLFAALHMLVEAIFWFHPLVWYLGTRLVEEREVACDEEVLELGSERQIYAESILKICEFCVGSPLACVSGVTGADLKRRIVRIMAPGATRRLDFGKKFLLGVAALAAIGVPVAFGFAYATQSAAQSPTQNTSASFAEFKYDVASFKLNKSGPGRAMILGQEDGLTATNFNLKELIGFAYGIATAAQDGRIVGAPSWITSEAYDVEGKMDGATVEALKKLGPDDRALARQHMFQKLLADRCKLAAHWETKEFPVYELVIAKGGTKIQESKPADAATAGRGGMGLKGRGGPLTAREVPISNLVGLLSMLLNRTVVDKTGLTGKYDFTLNWTPDESNDPSFFPSSTGQPPDPAGPSIFAALQEQLGLKLEAGKGPVKVIVIDHIERPSGN
jgi:bla regulator protein BlaR1